MTASINWGMLGAGYAAVQMAEGISSTPGSRIVSVASRSHERAQAFARRFGCDKVRDCYDDLVTDPDVDIVFVATPNHLHKAHCLLALDANKPVVCEKPFALTAIEALEVIQRAQQRRLFCMEGMWTRFMPAVAAARETIASGRLGEIGSLTAVLGHRIEFDPKSALYDPACGGGVLLDLGSYTVSLATQMVGAPATVVGGDACIGASGVDEQFAAILRFSNEVMATLSATFRASPTSELVVAGTKGSLRLHAPLYRPEFVSVSHKPNAPRHGASGGIGSVLARLRGHRAGEPPDEVTTAYPVSGNGAGYQVAEAAACLRAGRLESAVMPLSDTLAVMTLMDDIRAKWGGQ